MAEPTRQPEPRPDASEAPENTQLSPSARVSSGVSSFAMDPILPRSQTETARSAGGRRAAGLKVTSLVDYESLDDAQVMLRVKDGDDAGFDYLVTKFRRPMLA